MVDTSPRVGNNTFITFNTIRGTAYDTTSGYPVSDAGLFGCYTGTADYSNSTIGSGFEGYDAVFGDAVSTSGPPMLELNPPKRRRVPVPPRLHKHKAQTLVSNLPKFKARPAPCRSLRTSIFNTRVCRRRDPSRGRR